MKLNLQKNTRPTHPGSRRITKISALFAAVASVSLFAHAATDAWNTTTTLSSWASTGNWSLGTLPAATDTADFSQLGITAATAVTLDAANQNVGNIIFGNTLSNAASAWQINTGSVAGATLTFGGTAPNIWLTNALGAGVTINAQLAGTAGLTVNGPGNLTLSPFTNNTLLGGLTITKGATVFIGGAQATGQGAMLGGTLVLTNGGTLQMNGYNNVSSTSWGNITNTILVPAGTTGNLFGSGRGTLTGPVTVHGTLNLTPSYVRFSVTGDWSASDGVINVAGASSGGDIYLTTTANYSFGTALLNFNSGAGALYTAGNMGAAGITITIGDVSGNYGYLQGGNASAAARNTYFVVGGRNTSSTFGGKIQDSLRPAAITKMGTGTWSLSAWNNYTGPTLISTGAIYGVTGGTISNSIITVATNAAYGAATFGVQLASPGGKWIGTNLVLRSGSALAFNYGATAPSTTTAPLQLLGGITATNTVSLNILGGSGWTVGGVYPLAKYTSAFVGNGFSAFALGTLPLRVSGVLSNDTANSQIDFVVTAITQPLNWAASAGNWDLATTANWKDATGASTTYQEQNSIGDQVVLEDNVSGAAPALTLSTTVSPISLLVTNNSKAYAIAGTGGIAGAGSLTKQGANTLTLATANTFTGGLNLNAGTVVFSAQNNLGAGAINFGGGTLQYNAGNVADISGQTISFGAGGGTINDGGNTITLAKPIGNGGPGSFTKAGTGTLTLNGTNKYSGFTAVTGGTLALGSANTYISNSTAIILVGGATLDATTSGLTVNNQYLGGTGTVAGAVTVTNTSTLSPGTNNAYGTLTFSGNLTLGGGTNFLDVSTTNKDLIAVGGNLTLASAINSGSVFVNVHGTLTNGVYRLITYGGSLNGTFSTLSLSGFNVTGKVGSLSSTLNPNEIDLVVASAGSANLVWSGAGGSSWDVEATQNWLNGGSAAYYDDGDSLTFDDTSSNPSVSLAATFTPANVVIKATNNAYTFSGSGQISGSAGILLSGPAVTTIETVNNNSGPTVLNNGAVLQVGFGGPGDLGGGNITNNGAALIFDQAANATHVLASQISGTGNLVAEGSDPVVLAANNTYSGLTTISNSYSVLQVGTGGSTGNLGNSPGVVDNGVLALTVGGALALTNGVSGTGELIVNGSGTVALTGVNTYLGNTYISNGIVKLLGTDVIPDANSASGSTGWLILDGGANPAGTLDLNGNNETVNALSGVAGTYNGLITNSGSATATTNTLTVLGTAGTTYLGTIAENGTGAKVALTLVGANTLQLNAANTYSGGTYVGGTATLALHNGGGAGQGGIIMSNGTTLSLASSGSSKDPAIFVGNAVTVPDNSAYTVTAGSTGSGFNSPVSGSVTATNIVGGTVAVTFGASTKQLQGLLGTLVVNAGAGIRFSAPPNGGDYTTFDIEGGIYTKYAGMISMNGLVGSGTLSGGTAATTTYNVGVGNASSTFNGTIAGTGTGLTALIKSGTGTLTLAGSLTYGGATTISNGVLALSSSANLDNSPSIVLATATAQVDVSGIGGTFSLGDSIGQNLSGFGTVAGNLSISSSYGSYLTPGTAGTAGTLTINGNATLFNATTNVVDFSSVTTAGGGVNDLLQVNGDISLNGTVYVQPNFPQGGVAFGVPYTFIKYTGALTGDTNNLALAVNGTYGHLGASFNTSTPGIITVTFSPGPSLVWAAATANTWQLGVVTNWFDGVSSNAFYQLDNVTFNDTASNTTAMLVGTVTPASITVNSASNYVFGGAGLISGTTGLSKSGTGMLTISNTGASSYSGPVNITGGILRAGNANALGTTVGVTITNTGALDVGGFSFSAKPVTVSGAGTAGAIVNSGAAQQTALQFVTLAGNTTFGGPNRWDIRTNVVGTPYLAGNGFALTKVNTNDIYLVGLGNTALGNIQIQAGRLGVQDSTLLGTTGSLTLAAGAAVDLWLTTVTNTKAISLTNATISSGSGTNVLGSSIALNGTGTFTTAAPLQLNGALTGTGGIIKNGASTLTLAGADTYTGSTIISNGVLALAGPASLANSPTVDVTAGAQLDVSALASPTLALVSGQTLQGVGSVKGSVATAAGATLAPGEAAAGTLAISNNVTLGGNAVFVVNSTGVSSKLIAGGSIGLGGTLTINNAGPAFAVGNSFTLLSASTITGSFATISPATPGAGLAWNTTGLSTGVLSVVSGVASNPTNITFSLSGSTLSLAWPADHLGWILQSQTNADNVGLVTASNAWTDVAGSASSTSATITVDPAKPTVFFRLRQP